MNDQVPVLYGIRERLDRKGEHYQTRVYCPECSRRARKVVEHFHGDCFGLKGAHCRYKNAPDNYLTVELHGWTPELWAALIKQANNIMRLNRYFKPKRKRS